MRKETQIVISMAVLLILALTILLLFNPDGSMPTGLAVYAPDRDMTNTTTVYSVVPITKVGLDYSFDEYEEIVSKAKEMVEDCRGKSDPGPNYAALEYCIEQHMGLLWSVEGSEGTYYLFKVIGLQKVRQYDPNSKRVLDKELTYRFALDFS